MLAARDQENLVLSHQAGAAAKQHNLGARHFQPKTPGARFPKTPLKVPLNDENTTIGSKGKGLLRTKGNNENIATIGKGAKSNLLTPLEPRTSRAPLGNKTTNAKAQGTATGGVKGMVRDFENTQTKATTIRRPKQAAPQIGSSTLEVHNDKVDPLADEEDIEYAPPKPKDIPYESDVFPDGGMTFESLKPENLFKGYYRHYFNPVDDNGVSRIEREMEDKRQRDLRRLDEQVRKDLEEFDWGVGDVPEAKTVRKGTAAARSKPATKPTRAVSGPPSTIASRKAASALSMEPKPGVDTQKRMRKPAPSVTKGPRSILPIRRPSQRPVLTRNSSAERAAAVAASRSTIGYSKGRTALSAVQGSRLPHTNARSLTRTASTASSISDATITPARFAQGQTGKAGSEDLSRKLGFLSIFDGGDGGGGGEDDDDDSDDIGRTVMPQDDDSAGEEFKLDLGV